MKSSSEKILKRLLIKYPELENICNNIVNAINVLTDCYKNGGKVLVCGNGGSASDSEHIVGELMKGFLLPRELELKGQERIKEMFPENAKYLIDNLQQALPTISLVSQTSIQTAFANDNAPDLAFAQQVLGYGKEEDVLIAISTSGNSKNVLYASQVAKCKDMKVISLTGNKGGKLKSLSDVVINVPSDETFIIQEYHLPVYHAICACLENEFFGYED
ncbi:SIS domain-containing protein [Clostridium botulinum]|uniref:D-sedoheptulose-7-phosphate isomerase n=1 Tax=Clostridium botulinum TaxID=1491 RepID=UPI0019679FC1|nr:SIS domain-containing protein [Clostridium botulinum]MBN1075622.1 SIS domain-containing protein [Clostridium botulinum]